MLASGVMPVCSREGGAQLGGHRARDAPQGHVSTGPRAKPEMRFRTNISSFYRRKFRSQTSDNMDR